MIGLIDGDPPGPIMSWAASCWVRRYWPARPWCGFSSALCLSVIAAPDP